MIVEQKDATLHTVCGSVAGAPPLFTLMPGVNQISSEAWAEALKNPHFKKHYVEAGRVVVKNAEADPETASLSVKEAIEFVDEVLDLSLLRQLAAGETRPKVLKAIEAKIEYLTTPDEKKE